MVKMNLSDIVVSDYIAEMWTPLNEEQRSSLPVILLFKITKKNETIYCEGEAPTHLMCLLSGKVKIYKTVWEAEAKLFAWVKPGEYFGYRAYFAKKITLLPLPHSEPSAICLIPMSVITKLVETINWRYFHQTIVY